MRHGETDWSRAGRHTGRTDVPLNDAGRERARALAPALAGARSRSCSRARSRGRPNGRARRPRRRAQARDDLMEWDYGAYEGRTTAEIRTERPGWSLWARRAPGASPPPTSARAPTG